MVRIVVTMPEHESEILQSMAEGDMRFPKEQIRFLIREEAMRRGLLPDKPHFTVSKRDAEATHGAR